MHCLTVLEAGRMKLKCRYLLLLDSLGKNPALPFPASDCSWPPLQPVPHLHVALSSACVSLTLELSLPLCHSNSTWITFSATHIIQDKLLLSTFLT